jgi:hypothetical protein
LKVRDQLPFNHAIQPYDAGQIVVEFWRPSGPGVAPAKVCGAAAMAVVSQE